MQPIDADAEHLLFLVRQHARNTSNQSVKQRHRLQKCLGRLSQTDRALLLLRHQKCLSVQEIAVHSGFSAALVQRRLLHALERLCRLLRNEADEAP
jgi:RNA polymerase sigma factor (sigma-70 family)